MRAIICTDYSGDLRKLIWLTENKTGISAGICEADTNPHATYHVDGTYHHKINHHGRTIEISPSKEKIPLAAITTKKLSQKLKTMLTAIPQQRAGQLNETEIVT